jgi:hypothetical protein
VPTVVDVSGYAVRVFTKDHGDPHVHVFHNGSLMKVSLTKTIEPMLERVKYAAKRDVVVLRISNGALVEIPRLAVKELRNLTQGQLQALAPDNAGMTLSQRNLDIDIYLPGLLSEVLGVRPSAVLGRKGGTSRSAAKRRAAQRNGRRGGRPKKVSAT